MTKGISSKLRELNIEKYYPKFTNKLKSHPLYYCDLYGAVDSCLGDLGVGLCMDFIYKEDDIEGYRPYFKFYPHNVFNEPSREILIYDPSNFCKERGDAYKFLVKEILNSIEYRLE